MPASGSIKIGLNTKDADKDLKRFSDGLIGNIQPTIDVLQTAKAAWAQMERAIKLTVGEAMAAEKIERDLTTTLKLQGLEADKITARLKDYAAGLQRKTGLDDDQTLAIQRQLLLMGVQERHLETATKAVFGLSEVTGSLESAQRMVAETMSGKVSRGLVKLGFDAKDTQQNFDRMVGLFTLVEERADSFGGKLNALESEWGDFLQSIGKSIIENPEVLEFLDEVKGLVTDIIGQTEDGKPAIDAFISTLASGLTEIVSFIRENKTDIEVLLFLLAAGSGVKLGARLVGALGQTGVGALAAKGAAALGVAGAGAAAVGLAGTAGLAALIPDTNSDAVAKALAADIAAGIPASERAPAAAEVLPAEDEASNVVDFETATVITGRATKRARVKKTGGTGALGKQRFREELPPELQGLFGGVDPNQAAEMLKAANQIVESEEERHAKRVAEIRDNSKKELLAIALASLRQDQDIRDSTTKGWDHFTGSLEQAGAQMVQGIGQSWGAAVAAAASGQADLGTVMAQGLGMLVTSIGQFLISSGTAALASAALGGFFPFLRLTGSGGPEGIPAALAAIGIGTTLAAAGGAIAGAAGSARGAAPSAHTTSFGGGSAAPQGFGGQQGQGFGSSGPSSVIVNIQGGFFGADRRTTQRILQDVLRGRAA